MILSRTITGAWRQMRRNLVSTVINILGLSLGMACTFLILLYVIGEMSYEKHQKNRNQLFRIIHYDEGKANQKKAINYGMLASTIKNEIPEITQATLLAPRVNQGFYVRTGSEYVLEKGSVYEVDPDYFDMFTVPVIKGNPGHLIDIPHSVVLSKEMAEKFFGDENPMGRTLWFRYGEEDLAYTVTGVFGRIPGNTVFKPDFIVRFDESENERMMGWKFIVYEVYVLVSPNADLASISEKIKQIAEKYQSENKPIFELQNCSDIYLHSEDVYAGYASKGNPTAILIFSAIGLLILIIACLNFILLSTAESTLRYREIGIKKVVGAGRMELISQIQVESLFMALLSLPFALFWVERSKHLVSNWFGQEFPATYAGNGPFIIGFILITLLVGILSGSYLSLYLSRLKPVDILMTQGNPKSGKSRFSRIMIGFQLLIFVILFTSTSIMRNQVRYAFSLHPEFDLDKLLIIQNDQNHLTNFELFKANLERHPEIEKVSSAFSNLFLKNRWMNNAATTIAPDKKVPVEQYYLDNDYIETMKIEMLDGHSFMDESVSRSDMVILNQTAASELEMADPVGKRVISRTMFGPEQEYEVIGVVKDFVSGTVRQDINPLMLFVKPAMIPSRNIAIRLKSKLSDGGRAHIEQVWKELTGGTPVEFRYMDDIYKDLYGKEIRLVKLITFFTVLAIFISSLGLFGLSLFVARRRNKEIGIRKVFGAESYDVVRLFLQEFVIVILVANIIAIPVTVLVMNRWLQMFALKAGIGFGVFFQSLLISTLIVALTLTVNALRAVRMNPVDSLRNE